MAKSRPDSMEEYLRKKKEREAETKKAPAKKPAAAKKAAPAKKPATTKKPAAKKTVVHLKSRRSGKDLRDHPLVQNKEAQKATTEKALSTLIAKPVDPALRKEYVTRIQAALGKSVEGIIEVGQQLIDAKEKLAHGEFTAMVETDLKMDIHNADKIMVIARNSVLTKMGNFTHLPPAWTTLYQLTKVPEPKLEAKIKDGTINPQITGKEVKELQPRNSKKKEKFKNTDEPEAETTTTTTRFTMCPHCGGSGKVPVKGDF